MEPPQPGLLSTGILVPHSSGYLSPPCLGALKDTNIILLSTLTQCFGSGSGTQRALDMPSGLPITCHTLEIQR